MRLFFRSKTPTTTESWTKPNGRSFQAVMAAENGLLALRAGGAAT
jgi:hypothetical protein